MFVLIEDRKTNHKLCII